MNRYTLTAAALFLALGAGLLCGNPAEEPMITTECPAPEHKAGGSKNSMPEKIRKKRQQPVPQNPEKLF